jgi:apolipoprotein D and lipocalin family protein
VPAVTLERYMGRWFEVARYPTRFERECAKNTVAEYTLQRDGMVRIENRCTKADGTTTGVRGSARVADAATNAKLKVKFSPFMPAADYWIIDLDAAYRWAVVGEPKRRFLWVLSRTPGMDRDVYAGILQRLRRLHYVPERLVRTKQDGA